MDKHGRITSAARSAVLATASAAILTLGSVLALSGGSAAAQPAAAGTWSVIPVPNAGTAPDNSLASTSCPTITFCAAVGSAGTATLADVSRGGTWSVTPTPNVGTAGSSLDGVSCTSLTFCMAVGFNYVGTPPNSATLAEVYNGSTWSVSPTPDVPGDVNELTAVSCTSPTSCVAVGTYDTGSPDQDLTLVETFNGAAWTIVSSPNPAANADNILNAVSCPGAGACTAIGVWYDGATGDANTLVEIETAGGWSVVTTPDIPDNDNFLKGVSCQSASSCTAVGAADSSPTTHAPLVLSEVAGAWSIVSDPAQPSAASGLSAVSCTSATSCAAVGGYYTTGANLQQTLVMVETYGTWSVVSSPNVGTSDNSLDGTSCTTGFSCVAVGQDGNAGGPLVLAAPGELGYWEVAADGGIFPFGAAHFDGSMGGTPLNQPVVGMASTPDGGGYWEVASDGGIFSFGDASFYGSMGGTPLNQPVVGMASTPDGGGYWEVASDGGIFSFGDASFYGSMGGTPLNQPVVAMASTPDGGGYWEVASDGGIFSFGDASFYGSMGGTPLNQPVVGMASTPDGKGYWEVASDGGIFRFGDAAFHGSMGGTPLNQPVVAMASTPDGGGYWEVASDGGIFSFGDASFHGSMGGFPLNQPVVGIATPW